MDYHIQHSKFEKRVTVVLSLAICDSSKELGPLIKESLIKVSWNKNIRITTRVFYSGKQFLSEKDFHCDALIINPKLRDMSGIAVARAYKRLNSKCVVMLLADDDSVILEGYTVPAFRYYQKSAMLPHISEFMGELISKTIEVHEVLPFTVDRSPYCIKAYEIVYVESQGNKVLFHHCNKLTSLLVLKLSEVEAILVQYSFLRVHKSYLVNTRYLDKIIDTTMCFTNGDTITISRRRMDVVRASLADYFDCAII